MTLSPIPVYSSSGASLYLDLPAQKFELRTHICEWTQTSSLLVYFQQELLYSGNHLAQGFWSFSCFHHPKMFFQHYISGNWSPSLVFPLKTGLNSLLCFWCLSHHARVLKKHPKAAFSGWHFGLCAHSLGNRGYFPTDTGNDRHSIGVYNCHPFGSKPKRESVSYFVTVMGKSI